MFFTLFMENQSLPLPNRNEVLLCTENTSTEEVNISKLKLMVQLHYCMKQYDYAIKSYYNINFNMWIRFHYYQITLFFRKALRQEKKDSNQRIYCLLNADLLRYDVCDESLKTLMENMRSAKTGLFCSGMNAINIYKCL